jgi:hypothetical protein
VRVEHGLSVLAGQSDGLGVRHLRRSYQEKRPVPNGCSVNHSAGAYPSGPRAPFRTAL